MSGNKERQLDSTEIRDWLEDEPGFFGTFGRRSLAFYYNRVPRSFSAIGLLHWLLKAGLASAGPMTAAAMGNATWLVAGWVSLGLFGVYSTSEVLQKASAAPNKQGHEISTVMRFGDLLAALKRRAPDKDIDVELAISSSVAIIQDIAQIIVGSKDVGVSIVVYSADDRKTMKIRNRHPGSEGPMGRDIDAEKFFGHHLCLARSTPHVIHDINRMSSGARESPSNGERTYRSLFIAPLVNPGGGRNKKPKGFVTVTCDRPFAFYGNRTRKMIVNCQPLFDQIHTLLSDPGVSHA